MLLLGGRGRHAWAITALGGTSVRVLNLDLGARDGLEPCGDFSMIEISVFFDFYMTYFIFGTLNFAAFVHLFFMYQEQSVRSPEEVEDFPEKRWETGLPIRVILYRSPGFNVHLYYF
ncbi:hypothetical protein B0H13DRAFT_2360682 [Mycena leptocephala]|nr:hypothetical protein B0H13DRAFT_2360682 [Mycena leptocephala]